MKLALFNDQRLGVVNRPPLAPMGRVEGFGRQVGVALRSWDMRVLFIGSGGLSHSPPLSTDVMRLAEAQRASEMQRLLDGAAKLIQPEWDHRFLDLLEHGDWDTLASMAEEAVLEGGTGASEVRTWLAACAAVGVPPKRLIYEPIPEWITGMAIVATVDAASRR